MAYKALQVILGRVAAERIARDGWQADHFSLVVGASGGPKWFILSHLDRLLFGDFLQRGKAPLTTVGSSIGAWRNACFAMRDPAAAIARLEQGYLHQHYQGKPSAAEVSDTSLGTLHQVLGEDGIEQLVNNPRINTHIITARGRGPAGSTSTPVLAGGMGAAALGNAVNRKLLRHAFQRVVFHSKPKHNPELSFHDFHTRYVSLQQENLAAALHASGSIPFVLTGERDISGAPPGQYWDGGIIDYHFDLDQYHGDGLILYPHFRADITPGWFDKFLPWRKATIEDLDKLVLLCPSEAMVADLPHQKIPDRRDFTRLSHEERVIYWQTCVERNKALAEEFSALATGSDPLAGATILP
ncbi:MAG: patatin-like phospholipase family protein [Halieaceae bacterium]